MDLGSTQRDYGQTAQACGKALITLINEVLDRAKIEAEKLELAAVPFDIRFILDEVLSLFSEKFRQKGIELAVFVSNKVPEMFMGNPGRFRQVITNFVGNSVKISINLEQKREEIVQAYFTTSPVSIDKLSDCAVQNS